MKTGYEHVTDEQLDAAIKEVSDNVINNNPALAGMLNDMVHRPAVFIVGMAANQPISHKVLAVIGSSLLVMAEKMNRERAKLEGGVRR